MNKITEALASDANVDANEIKKLIKLFDEAREAQVKSKKVSRESKIAEEQGNARNEFSNFLRTKIASEHYVVSYLNAELELNKGSISKYLRGDRFPSYQMMLKMLQADDNIATKLNFTADEIDEFIDLWKQGNPRMSKGHGGGSHGLTKEAQRELDNIVARTKEHIRAVDAQDAKPEPQASDASQIAEVVGEARHVEAEQFYDEDTDKLLSQFLNSDDYEYLKGRISSGDEEFIKGVTNLSDLFRSEITAMIQAARKKGLLLDNFNQAMVKANISWEDIGRYVDEEKSFLAVFRGEIDAAIARRDEFIKRRGVGDSFYELVERNDGINKDQLQKYLNGESPLGADAYEKLCIYTKMGCGEDIMRAVEQVLFEHRKFRADSKFNLEINDYIEQDNSEWLQLAYEVLKKSEQQ